MVSFDSRLCSLVLHQVKMLGLLTYRTTPRGAVQARLQCAAAFGQGPGLGLLL